MTTGGPRGTEHVEGVPHGQTAYRLEWPFLPPEVRALVENELGSPVVKAESRNAGFTPGFAPVLTGANGAQVFVKAASKIAQAEIARAYTEEIRRVVALDETVPAPQLEWFSREESWVLLGYEAVASRQPRRPWTPADLTRALDLADRIAVPAAQLPAGLELAPLVDDLPELVTGWAGVDADWPHRAEAAELAASLAGLPADHLVHADLRDDNILLASDGRTLACDWNWPGLGSAWQDALDLLVSAHGDGVDAEAVLRRQPARGGRPRPRRRLAGRRDRVPPARQPAPGAAHVAVPAGAPALDRRVRLVLAGPTPRMVRSGSRGKI